MERSTTTTGLSAERPLSTGSFKGRAMYYIKEAKQSNSRVMQGSTTTGSVLFGFYNDIYDIKDIEFIQGILPEF